MGKRTAALQPTAEIRLPRQLFPGDACPRSWTRPGSREKQDMIPGMYRIREWGSPLDLKPWILIVDEEAKLRFTLSVILKRAGYGVIGAEDAGQALRQLKLRRFHLVFLDIGMPECDGLRLMAEIVRLYAGLPVVILTGDDSVDTTLQAMRNGACAYLLKPINPWQILSCLEQLLPAVPRYHSSAEVARPQRSPSRSDF